MASEKLARIQFNLNATIQEAQENILKSWTRRTVERTKYMCEDDTPYKKIKQNKRCANYSSQHSNGSPPNAVKEKEKPASKTPLSHYLSQFCPGLHVHGT